MNLSDGTHIPVKQGIFSTSLSHVSPTSFSMGLTPKRSGVPTIIDTPQTMQSEVTALRLFVPTCAYEIGWEMAIYLEYFGDLRQPGHEIPVKRYGQKIENRGRRADDVACQIEMTKKVPNLPFESVPLKSTKMSLIKLQGQPRSRHQRTSQTEQPKNGRLRSFRAFLRSLLITRRRNVTFIVKFYLESHLDIRIQKRVSR